jgi:hypothetical protein
MNEPRELIFFTDRDLGRQFPALLRDAGVRLERHDDHFGPDTPDEEWAKIRRDGVHIWLRRKDWRSGRN